VLEARPALLPGDESGANFHSSPSGNANSSKERLPNVRKTCCIESGEEICPRRENEDEGKGFGEPRDIRVRPCSQIRCSRLSSVDVRIRDF
jgi:hypothetical protein